MRKGTLLGLFGFITLSPGAQGVDYKMEGDNFFAKKNYAAAQVSYTKAIEQDPNDTEAYLARGQSKYKQKAYQSAIEDYNQILTINPEVRAINWIYVYRGLAKSAIEKDEEAVEDYSKAFDDLSLSDELQPEEYVFHTQAWPSLEQMLIIQKSFKKVSSQASQLQYENKAMQGKWKMEGSWGSQLVTLQDGVYTSSWGTKSKKTYEVIYSSNHVSIIALDSLIGDHSKTYTYGVAKMFQVNKEEAKNKEAELDSNQLVFRDYGDAFFSDIQMAPLFGRMNYQPLSRITKAQMNGAMQLLGLKERDVYVFGRKDMFAKDFGYDEEMAGKMYESFHTQVPAALDEKTLQTLSQTIAYLDPYYASLGYLPAALMLLKHGKIMEAAFMLYVGQLRENYYDARNPGAYDRFESPINQMVNEYLNDHFDAYVEVRKKSLQYYIGHENNFAKPRKEELEVYEGQVAHMKEQISGSYTYRADQSREEGNLKGAIEDYTQAIEIFPGSVDGYMGRGKSKHGLEDFSGEMLDYNKALEIEPEYSEAYYCRGLAKQSLGQKDSSCMDFQKAVDLGDQYEAQQAIFEFCTKEKEAVNIDPQVGRELTGKYEIQGDVMNISVEKNKLFLQPDNKGKLEFFAEDDYHFFSKIYLGVTLEFIREDGKVVAMILHANGKPQTLKKTE